MKKYYVKVSYFDRIYETYVVTAADEDGAEQQAYRECGGPDGFEVGSIEEK